MPPRSSWRIVAVAFLASRLAVAHEEFSLVLPHLDPPEILQLTPVEPPSWFDTIFRLPMLRFLSPAASAGLPEVAVDVDIVEPRPISVSPDCAIDPLPLITDDESMDFEQNLGLQSGVLSLEGLTPTTVTALERFRHTVISAGGLISITSTYRPAGYQEHLQAVWDKWMKELRFERSGKCKELRDQVQEEFTRHQLLRRQRPAGFSDHTLGIGFDASVSLPRGARYNRRRVSVDRLAKQAGVSRPISRRDPVHFRLVSGRV